VAFLDINRAYNNVLIDVLCDVMLEKELFLGVVRFIWFKKLVFCVENVECMTLNGYKSFPWGLVLSPFLYNLIGS
jgi:hypothetical protein